MNQSASEQLQTDIPASISAMVLLNSACQGVVETYIDQGNAEHWYAQVEQNLNAVQKLVRQWRLSGNLYFSNDIMDSVLSIANTFKDSNVQILTLFKALETRFDTAQLQQLTSLILTLQNPIQSLTSNIKRYDEGLNAWARQVEDAHNTLQQTIAQIQQEEVSIQAEIIATNAQIDLMKQQIAAFKTAIANAQSQRKKGIFETIFGVVLAPFTLGGSLILAGFGVSSIVEAQSEISSLQSDIQSSLNTINHDQQTLSQDQQQIASLNALLLSVDQVNNDCAEISRSLDTLQTTVLSLYNETNNVVSNLTKAQDSQAVILEQVWYQSAYNEWQDILEVASTLNNAQPQITKAQIK
ncbi:non-hemolytic enterotoxin lytic component L1 [Vibrio cholerae]|uniref:alpha-pore-forming cytotoxin subunit MakE n=1 Tax=Vibrio cholerae TaxID=666 RepID=UPI0004E2DB47|nr:enterotoxin [Vibrio cholerae]EKR8727229.1 non-hemolytic enterotoxin lytic component L1 [Vibrio cholerae]ELD6109012.1 non-hemolytic enterotoxin lytic component L1 [Vibrio cholerae]KFE10669.1 apolipoL family protein [Vibrio cholerae]TXZ77647.1 non-hemolytic enterotoxin lytic component L1 [Vibrio cholerae]GHZ86739.1 hypothetical protein VCSRO35_0036 [Vibrio cholerae]